MQIAKLFASLGFEVDYSQVNNFEARLKTAQTEIKEFARETNNSNRKLQSMVEKLKAIKSALDMKATKPVSGNLHATTKEYGKQVGAVVAISKTLESSAPVIEKAIERLGRVAAENTLTWYNYGTGANHANTKLQDLLRTIKEIRTLGGGRTTIAVGGGSGGTRSGAGRPSGSSTPEESGGGLLPLLLGGRAFTKPMLPTGVGLGGLLGAGYATKEFIQTGREMQAMESKLKAVSRDALDFQKNLEYVRKTSNALAMDVEEFGKSYSSIFQSAKRDYTTEQVQKSYTGFNKYFRALGMTQDQVNGSLRAIGQMFNKQQVMSEELKGQLGERAAGTMDIFAQAAGMSVPELMKAMEEGKIKSDVIMKAADVMGRMAEKNGAMLESLKTSAAAQTIFNNKMKATALVYLRILDPALKVLFDTLSLLLDVLAPLASVLKPIVDMMTRLADSVKVLVDVIKGMTANTDWLRTSLLALGVAFIAIFAGIAGRSTVAEGSVTLLRGAVVALRGSMLLLAKASPVLMFLALIELTRQLHDYYASDGKADNWLSVLAAQFERDFTEIGLWIDKFTLFMLKLENSAKSTFNEMVGIKWSEAFPKEGDVGFLESVKKIVGEKNFELTSFAPLQRMLEAKAEININITNQDGTTTQSKQTVPLNFTQGAAVAGSQ
jgi:tape measure domain-containing protein